MPESSEHVEFKSINFEIVPVYGQFGVDVFGLLAVCWCQPYVEFGRGNDSDRCLSLSTDLGRRSAEVSLYRCFMSLNRCGGGVGVGLLNNEYDQSR
jgi:hypothetical protein